MRILETHFHLLISTAAFGGLSPWRMRQLSMVRELDETGSFSQHPDELSDFRQRLRELQAGCTLGALQEGGDDNEDNEEVLRFRAAMVAASGVNVQASRLSFGRVCHQVALTQNHLRLVFSISRVFCPP